MIVLPSVLMVNDERDLLWLLMEWPLRVTRAYGMGSGRSEIRRAYVLLFRPLRVGLLSARSRGLRRGLYSGAASRLCLRASSKLMERPLTLEGSRAYVAPPPGLKVPRGAERTSRYLLSRSPLFSPRQPDLASKNVPIRE